jgi:hypothetical protein
MFALRGFVLLDNAVGLADVSSLTPNTARGVCWRLVLGQHLYDWAIRARLADFQNELV